MQKISVTYTSIVLRIILALFIAVPLLIHYGNILSRGIYLPFEVERDGRTLAGIVTRIEPEKESPQYFLEEYDGILRASFVTIDDDTFYFISANELNIGDKIRIIYLPKSRIVLSCKAIP